MVSHNLNETNFDLFVPESIILTILLLMQTSLGTRHLKMGMWMLNMQFNADKGLLWSIKSPKINNIENPKSVFSKFTPIRVIQIIRIFDLVHYTNKIQNNPNGKL